MPETFAPGLKVTLIICGDGTNDAVTACAVLIVTLQPAFPLHALPQAAKVLVPLGVAVSVTRVPLA